jgi:hypothetical protein
MNPPLAPLDPKSASRPAEKTSFWDRLARELSDEWRGLDADDAMAENPAPLSFPRPACL